ncbi:MAG: hypothetical protein U1E05_26595, partial [Patescibacteria group bacterium]|nr:hypothetical protein [Patescibacteria group bacterium]
GPAPRPLPRYAIRIAADGQIEVDRGRVFRQELGQWSNPASFIADANERAEQGTTRLNGDPAAG